jgi:capsular exopolysaccharide synthesis family protein
MAYNVILAMAIGLVLSVSAAFLLEYIDDTIKTADDVHHALDLKVLGSIARIDGEDYPSRLVVTRYPRSPIAEAYRMLRTNLQYSTGEGSLRTLVVTSANPLEGKSLTAANLAAATAQSGKHVILIDADMRRPAQHKIFQLDNQVGLSTVLLRGDISIADVVQAVPVANLNVVTAGPETDNPSELLGSERMGDLIELLQQYADILIFDTPPVMAVSDAVILACCLDGTLIVIDAGHTRRGSIQRSKEALTAVGARLVGVALNRLSAPHTHYYYYYSSDGKRHRRRSARTTLNHLFGRNGHSAGEAEATSVSPQEPAEVLDDIKETVDTPQD